MLIGVLALAAIVGPGMTSNAALYAEHALGGLQITGATVGDPVGPLVLASVDAPLASARGTHPVTGSWGAPVALTAPDRYLVYRKLATSEIWGSTPVLESATPSFTDLTAEHCSTYDYRVFAGLKALKSGAHITATVTNDHTRPNVAASYIEAAPNGLAPVGGFLRPGAPFYVYAHVSDDCALADATLTVDLRSLGVPGIQTLSTIPGDAPGTFGRVERDNVDYNFRAGPFTVGALPDGAAPAWTIRADDGRGNVTDVTGRAATVDGTGPAAVVDPQAVPSPADTYTGSNATIGAGSDFRVYAQLTDAGAGVAASPVLDARSLDATATATAMAIGPWSAGPISQWSHRSGVLRAAANLQGDIAFSIVATDRLGNVASITGAAHIDRTGPSLVSCAMASSNHIWDAGDTTTLTFSEAVLPSSAVSGWNGESRVLGATKLEHRGNGNGGDVFTYGDTVNLIAGGSGHVLGSGDWVTGQGASFGGTTLARISPTTWQITYGGTGAVPIPVANGAGGLAFRPSPLLTDVWGNAITATTGVPCSITYVAQPVAAAVEPQQQVAMAPETDVVGNPDEPAIAPDDPAVPTPEV